MPDILSAPKSKTDEDLRTLKAAFEQVQKFSPSRSRETLASDEKISKSVQEEASYGRVHVNEDGITVGMQMHLVPLCANDSCDNLGL